MTERSLIKTLAWPIEDTEKLIQIYATHVSKIKVGASLKPYTWKEIAKELNEAFPDGTPKSAAQCNHKIDSIRKKYARDPFHVALITESDPLLVEYPKWDHFISIHAIELTHPNPIRETVPPTTSKLKKMELVADLLKDLNDAGSSVDETYLKIRGLRSKKTNIDFFFDTFFGVVSGSSDINEFVKELVECVKNTLPFPENCDEKKIKDLIVLAHSSHKVALGQMVKILTPLDPIFAMICSASGIKTPSAMLTFAKAIAAAIE